MKNATRLVLFSATLVAAITGMAMFLPAAAQSPSDAAAKVGERVISRAELLEKASQQLAKLRQEEYDILKGQLDQMVDDMLIEAAAKKAGKTSEQYMQENIDAKVIAPTDAEVSATYEQFKSRLGGQTLEQSRPRLLEYLQGQQKSKLYTDLLASLRIGTPVTVLLDPPRIQVSVDDDPSQGPATAPVTIVAFSDYQCPYCSRAEPTITEVRKKYGDKVHYVFRDYPLSFHKNAQKAAEAAGCASEQGKFWEMHEVLFKNATALELDNLKKYAVDLGLDTKSFNDCLESGKRAKEVTDDMNAGSAIGVTGTPAFFVNGRMISGAMPLETFTAIIDDELARAANKASEAPTGKKSKKS